MTAKGTSIQNIRVDRELWADAKAAAEEQGTDRSAVVRAFLEWYVGRPGARLPERPGGDNRADALDRVAEVRRCAVRALREIEEQARSAREYLD